LWRSPCTSTPAHSQLTHACTDHGASARALHTRHPAVRAARPCAVVAPTSFEGRCGAAPAHPLGGLHRRRLQRRPDVRRKRGAQAAPRRSAAPATCETWSIGWSLRGRYFESCNCDAICPCRRIKGTPGGRSTHGTCLGVLSWLIEEGRPMASTWRGCRWPSRCATATMSRARRGRGSCTSTNAPPTRSAPRWRTSSPASAAATPPPTSHGHGSRASSWPFERVAIDVDHTRRRQRLRIRNHVSVRIRDRHHVTETVTCTTFADEG
jgi:hypothetical protein